MESLNLNTLLDRDDITKNITNILDNFEKNRSNLLIKRGIYLYGNPGIGKTTFVIKLLKLLDYDVIHYDAGDIRNKNIIDTITKDTMANTNVISYFTKKRKKIVIVMDEIDGMNNGDKGGINSLIKIIRPKKTKKQKTEELSNNLIICIGNYHIDKKIKELMKVCETIELKSPTLKQSEKIITQLIPNIDKPLLKNIVYFSKNDLRKISLIYNLFKNNKTIDNNIIKNIFECKCYNEDAKDITKNLINTDYTMDEHLLIMNDTERTIVGLLWHENIVDVLSKTKPELAICFYEKILKNICFADYIDRITFQKQIWLFNEMSSLIKTFYNNKLYHQTIQKKQKFNPAEVRFTKVLTKYSTEYNNALFLQGLSQELMMDRSDIIGFFLELQEKYTDEEVYELFEQMEISKLDINRIFRYLNKHILE